MNNSQKEDKSSETSGNELVSDKGRKRGLNEGGQTYKNAKKNLNIDYGER